MNAKDWLDRLTDDASVNAAAQKAGVPQKTLDTQLRSHTGLKPDMVVKIARAYGASPVAALVDLELITEAEARDAAGLESMRRAVALREARDAELLTEIGRRLGERKRHAANLGEEVAEDL